jgi:hypothetical protein
MGRRDRTAQGGCRLALRPGSRSRTGRLRARPDLDSRALARTEARADPGSRPGCPHDGCPLASTSPANPLTHGRTAGRVSAVRLPVTGSAAATGPSSRPRCARVAPTPAGSRARRDWHPGCLQVQPPGNHPSGQRGSSSEPATSQDPVSSRPFCIRGVAGARRYRRRPDLRPLPPWSRRQLPAVAGRQAGARTRRSSPPLPGS